MQRSSTVAIPCSYGSFCYLTLDFIFDTLGLDVFDVAIPCSYGSFCYGTNKVALAIHRRIVKWLQSHVLMGVVATYAKTVDFSRRTAFTVAIP